jgi:hypothetical protein
VVEEVTAGWNVYDETINGFSEQSGVRVVRYAAAVEVSGATGPAAATINGVYRPVAGEGVGGKPVYKKDGADTWSEYLPGTEQWQLKPGSSKGKDAAWMASLDTQKEARVVEEVTAGWNIADGNSFSKQAGVRVVRYAAAVQEELLAGLRVAEAGLRAAEAGLMTAEAGLRAAEAKRKMSKTGPLAISFPRPCALVSVSIGMRVDVDAGGVRSYACWLFLITQMMTHLLDV